MVDTILNLFQVLCLFALIFVQANAPTTREDASRAESTSRFHNYFEEGEDGPSPSRDEEKGQQDQETQTTFFWGEKQLRVGDGSSTPRTTQTSPTPPPPSKSSQGLKDSSSSSLLTEHHPIQKIKTVSNLHFEIHDENARDGWEYIGQTRMGVDTVVRDRE
jgi:hypothetical protein